MEYQEYMDTLREQITDKHAREMVTREIEGHIAEQANAYEAEGMEHEEALREAVRQMGDPVETGSALGQIHRPVTPWQMLLLAFGITLVSLAVQGAIIAHINGVGWQTEQFYELVFFHVIGFGVIFALLYADYTFFIQHIYAFYGGYLCLTAVIMGCSGDRWFLGSAYVGYALLSMQPLLFAGVLYRNRNRGIWGILVSIAVACAATMILIVMENLWLPNTVSTAAIIENELILFVMLLAALGRGIYAGNRRKQVLAVLVVGVLLGVCGMLMVYRSPYQRARLTTLFNAADSMEGYCNTRIREAVDSFTLTGTGTFSEMAVREAHYEGVYLLNDIFSYFGIALGVAVFMALVVFVVYAFRVTFRQSSRMGFLVGLACSCSICVRLIAYVAINFGYAVWYTTAVPFLGNQWLSILTNAVYVGLLLCVARNTMTVGNAADDSRSLRVALK